MDGRLVRVEQSGPHDGLKSVCREQPQRLQVMGWSVPKRALRVSVSRPVGIVKGP
jgi:hypothetical protein